MLNQISSSKGQSLIWSHYRQIIGLKIQLLKLLIIIRQLWRLNRTLKIRTSLFINLRIQKAFQLLELWLRKTLWIWIRLTKFKRGYSRDKDRFQPWTLRERQLSLRKINLLQHQRNTTKITKKIMSIKAKRPLMKNQKSKY